MCLYSHRTELPGTHACAHAVTPHLRTLLLITNAMVKNARVNRSCISMLKNTGCILEKLNSVILAILLFAFTYQYVGVKLAIFSTVLPSNSVGTNTPLIKQSPRVATVLTAGIVFAFFTRFPTKKLMLAPQKANISEFI